MVLVQQMSLRNSAVRKDWESVEGEGGRLLTSEDTSRRDMEAEAQNLRFFSKVFTLAQVVGILIVVLLVVWLTQFRDGFAWISNPKLEFNWHPLLMVIALIFLYANGILVYRAFRNEVKKKLKLIHAAFHFVALILTIIGLQAVFDSHNLNVDKNNDPAPILNLYSLHSWIGLIVVILYACQWLVGLITFLFPGMRLSLRSAYMPTHQFFGVALFIGAVAAALLGLNEKAIFVISDYSHKVPEGILVNCIGLCLVAFCGIVVYLVTNTSYKRRATEDEILLTDTVME